MIRLFPALARRRLVVLLLGGVTVSALVTACDARQPLAPSPPDPVSPPPVRTASLPAPPAPVELGSVFVGVPPSTSVADAHAAAQDWQIVGAFGDSTWILVDIEGGVTHTANMACATLPPFWGCASFPFAGLTVGPARRFTSGLVDLWDNGAGSPVRYRAVGGDPDALAARALVFTRVAGTLSVRRHVEIAGAIEPLSNRQVAPTYFLSGGQTVRLRAVPPPVEISGPADLAPGETGTYSAGPLFGLELVNSDATRHLPPGAFSWSFHPGDTAAVARKRVRVGLPIRHCDDKPTCDYTPSQSGRLAVFAYVEEKSVGAYSGVIRVGKPTLSVRCEPSAPVRGQTVDCRSTVTPAQPFSIVERRAVGKRNEFQVLDTTRTTHAAGDSSSWAGPAIAPTRIRIRAVLPNSTDTLVADADFDITRRTWSVYEITNPRVRRDTISAALRTYMRVLGEFQIDDIPPSELVADSVLRGPNTGLVMLARQPNFATPYGGTAYMHPALYPPPPGGTWAHPDYQAWYNDQNGIPSGTCRPADFPAIRREAERHEGVTVAPNSHVGVANRVLRTKKLHEIFEGLYIPADTTAPDIIFEARSRFIDFATNEYYPAQNAFDVVDTPATWAAIGCRTDINRSDP
jgi:hypothetical protein